MSSAAALLISAAAGLGAGLILHSPLMALVTGLGAFVLLMVVKLGRGG